MPRDCWQMKLETIAEMDGDKLTHRISNLSPDKRALLELRLKKRGLATSAGQTIPRRATRDSPPLAFAQQRLWFLNQLEPESCAYNQPKAVRLSGPLDVTALRQALDQIVARHEVLRTTFAAVEGSPVQVIAESRSLDLAVIDLRTWPDTVRDAEVHRLLAETIRRPFDLSRDLMLRGLLLGLDDEQHILLLVTHHIASDGLSSGILWQELTALYRASASGHPPSLQEPPVQYADYAVWQRQWLQGEVLATQLSYWKKRLSDIPVLQLPTDRPRPAVQGDRGATHAFVLPKDLSEALKALNRQEGATLFMTLLAAFQTLLHRYTGQSDIVVGSPIAGRNRTEIERLIGFFVNTVVLRTDLSGNPTFRQLLARVQDIALGAYLHQDLPFEKLVEELHPERNLSTSPLFQVMFGYQNAPRQPVELPGLTTSPIDVDSGTAKFDLLLSMREDTGGLRGSLEYNTDLFDPATITRMVDHFQTLLRAIVADPDRPLSELSLLTGAERQQLLGEWNDTDTPYPSDTCVHHLFEAQVERAPDSVALVFEDQHLTYRELNRRANRLAHYLRTLGVGPEALVGICMERSLEMVVAVLGILKAGGTYVPLDREYPKERLAFMLEDALVTVLLTQARLADDSPEHRAHVVYVDTDWELIAQESAENPFSGVTAENSAYVLYTSGSTGHPKAVAMSHRPLCNLLSWQLSHFTPPLEARTLQFASLSFDVSFQEIFSTWCSGGTLLMISEDLRRDAAALFRFLEAKSVERLFVPFVVLQQLAEVAASKGSLILRLRDVITAGEQLHITRPIARLFDRLEHCHLHNQYGPSETHVVTSFTLTGSPSGWPALPPIGRPVSNAQIYLLDDHLHPVPIGITGQLHIGSNCLARGYLNLPDLTAEKFISHPFRTEPGARLYKTGDLARYMPDGNIEFLGRIDHQVKLRGFRIELGEVETVLGRHAAVQHAVVVASGDVPAEKRLAAYVVLHQQATATISELRSFLRTKLPDYMVPSAFVVLDALPVTPNGKVDRDALPAPSQHRSELAEALAAPRTPGEEALATIWADVLKLDTVGAHDNFFDLGGHSLLAVQVVSRVRKAFHVELPLRSLFQTPTVAGLAATIEAAHRKERASRFTEDRHTDSRVFALQPGQSQKRIFCFPYAGGFQDEYFNFTRLARLIGPDYSFYGIRARGTDGVSQPRSCLEDMAADYAGEIQTVQPHGPYYLIGECGGSPEAYETARQLQARGEKLALLVFLDAPGPGSLPRYLWRRLTARLRFRIIRVTDSWAWGYFTARAGLHLREIQRLKGRERWRYLFNKIGKTRSVLSDVRLENSSHSQPVHMNGGTNRRASRHMTRARTARYLARSRYRPRPYGGRVTVLMNEEWHGSVLTLGWARVAAGGVEVHKIPGNHDTYFTHNIEAVAERLRQCLEKAEKSSVP